jgi:hypothetical protein
VWPAIVIGAGAAGLTAAIFAGRGGVPVLILETRPKPGAKIRISGGGRCNVLPSKVELDDFHTSGSRNRMRNVLFAWPLEEVHAFFEKELDVALKVEPTGKVFPRSDDSRDVVAALLRECTRAGVTLRSSFRVSTLQRVQQDREFLFRLGDDGGETLHCRRVVLASGGLSLPKTGSDGLGMEIAKSLGHRLAPPYPALVPLLCGDASWHELAGLAVRARLTASRGGQILEQREGDLLFTQRGFSGPVVLDMSHHVAKPGSEDVQLLVRWGTGVPDWDALLREGGGATLGALLRRRMPRRLAVQLLRQASVDRHQRASELSRELRLRLVAVLGSFVLPVSGSEGYRTAEVTGGGVPLEEVVTASLESRSVPGLYFCGEILDVTGRLGGYNFLWAWVSGRKVGVALAAAHAGESAAGSIPRRTAPGLPS